MQSTLPAHGRDLLTIVLSCGTTGKIFYLMIRNLDPTIKFTKEDDTKEPPFLDITVIKNHGNSIATDIFYTKTNSHRYLDFPSCHRHHTEVNIPYNLAQRICKIVSDNTRGEDRLLELKGFLLSCYYQQKSIDHAIRNAKEGNNSTILDLPKQDIIPLVITQNPNHAINFSSIKSRINSVECPRLQRAFKNKSLLSTRQPANLKRLLTRVEFNPEEETGIVPCTRSNCDLQLGYLKRETEAKSPTGATLFKLNKRFHYNSKFVLYLLTCPVSKATS